MKTFRISKRYTILEERFRSKTVVERSLNMFLINRDKIWPRYGEYITPNWLVQEIVDSKMMPGMLIKLIMRNMFNGSIALCSSNGNLPKTEQHSWTIKINLNAIALIGIHVMNLKRIASERVIMTNIIANGSTILKFDWKQLKLNRNNIIIWK